MAIDLDTVIQRSEEIVEAEIDGELVMMSVENASYYGLDPIGKRIWELAEAPISLKNICAKIQVEYDVAAVDYEADVMAFVEQLVAKNIVLLRS